MLAIGRALMSKPKLLCIDEPSTGLAPLMKSEVFKKIDGIRKMGITVLLIEQEVSAVFEMADRNYVLSSGKIIAEGTGEQLRVWTVDRKGVERVTLTDVGSGPAPSGALGDVSVAAWLGPSLHR